MTPLVAPTFPLNYPLVAPPWGDGVFSIERHIAGLSTGAPSGGLSLYRGRHIYTMCQSVNCNSLSHSANFSHRLFVTDQIVYTFAPQYYSGSLKIVLFFNYMFCPLMEASIFDLFAWLEPPILFWFLAYLLLSSFQRNKIKFYDAFQNHPYEALLLKTNFHIICRGNGINFSFVFT